MNRRLRFIAVAAVALLASSCATFGAPPDAGPVIVIQNATILTVHQGHHPNALHLD
jgi:hypothetical protein